jgi:hypothetical protein
MDIFQNKSKSTMKKSATIYNKIYFNSTHKISPWSQKQRRNKKNQTTNADKPFK